MAKLQLKNLHVSVNGKKILRGVNLEIESGKVHALMGPNGSGKSTIANVIMGNQKYKVEKGKILLNGKDITGMSADERAKLGLFLSFQYPCEVTGVTISNFLRTAYNNLKEEKLDVVSFHKLLKEKMKLLGIDEKFGRRYLNEGFSGGEKKKSEILQLAVLQPKFAILDETDSGTDIDALKTIANGINTIKKSTGMGCLLITHYNRILKYIKVDKVSVIKEGRITKEAKGDVLAHEIESKGYSHVS
ncbi:Fe-S cluster assembly ATPase SufC [Candidatus Woesearchaeota archaeon]|nr:MAG: Fe-S cluster assembly ATPase SufC [Candidatus Woesearchaeota archaeon]